MKKKTSLITIVLIVAALLALTACGSGSGGSGPKALHDYEVELGEGITPITLYGTYYENEIPASEAENGMVGYYTADDETYPDLAVYRYTGEEETAEETAQQVADYFGVFMAGLKNAETPSYYVCMPQVLEDKFFVTNNYFIDSGEDVVEVEFRYRTEEVALGESGLKLWIPLGSSADAGYELPGESPIAVYAYEDDLFTDISVCEWTKAANSLDASFGVDDLFLFYDDVWDTRFAGSTLVYNTTFESNGHDTLLMAYDYTAPDGTVYSVERYSIDLGDEFVELLFSSDDTVTMYTSDALFQGLH